MRPITGNAVVSCYVDAASFVVMLMLLFLSRLFRLRKSESRIFYGLSGFLTLNCILPFVYNAMYMQTAPWCHTAALICKTLRECNVLVIVVLWLLFVDHKLNGKKNWRSIRYRLALLPLGVLFVLLIVNLFTGIAFTYSSENLIRPKPLLYGIFAVEFAYLVYYAAAMVIRYDRNSMKIRFLHVSPIIIFIALAAGTQLFAPYDIGILGYVTGFILLCFSMISESRFLDEESGLYNRGYLAFLFDRTMAGRYDVRSAMIMVPSGNLQAGMRILHDTLQKDYDVIRIEEKKFLMFSRIARRSEAQLLSTHVEESAAKHNAEHPEDKVWITTHCRMRKEDEDPVAFLRSTLEEKDFGNPVKGVVSMLSDLDRLDQELKLAADIQVSALPQSFPAFPDRKEFDLYASMTPAKEVGGDFYDFFLIDDDHLALVIADVSGKGIPAALFMMVSRTLIKNQLMDGCDPATTLQHVNLQLCESNDSMMFVTVWLAVLQISTGKGIACNAGHEYPAVRRAGGDFQLFKYKHSTAVGVSERARFLNREFYMREGDCIFVYTDGVPEATDASSEMFGTERMTDSLNRYPDGEPEKIVHHMHEAIDRFVDSTPQFDDITMLCMKYYGKR